MTALYPYQLELLDYIERLAPLERAIRPINEMRYFKIDRGADPIQPIIVEPMFEQTPSHKRSQTDRIAQGAEARRRMVQKALARK